MVSGLETLHDHNIVYGDLSPLHISVDETGFLCLSDLSFDKILLKSNQQSVIRALEYCAPEVVYKKLHFNGMTGKEADWYSLGVLM